MTPETCIDPRCGATLSRDEVLACLADATLRGWVCGHCLCLRRAGVRRRSTREQVEEYLAGPRVTPDVWRREGAL